MSTFVYSVPDARPQPSVDTCLNASLIEWFNSVAATQPIWTDSFQIGLVNRSVVGQPFQFRHSVSFPSKVVAALKAWDLSTPVMYTLQVGDNKNITSFGQEIYLPQHGSDSGKWLAKAGRFG